MGTPHRDPVAPETAEEVIKTVTHLKERAGFPLKKSPAVLNLPARTYHRWTSFSGKKHCPEGRVPKGHWTLPEEREKIVAFKRQHPTVGGVRLTYMILDQGVVAVSPSTVFRVGRAAGLPSKWTLPDGRKASRQGFHQLKMPLEQWHSDIAYINLRGTHYFFISVLDGYSRAIVFRDLCLSMTTADVAIVIQRALETLPKGMAKPRIISDNGPQYLSTEFHSYLLDQEVVHSRIHEGHPQSNGKIERFHKTLKSECVRTQALGGFEEGKTIIASYVHEYNNERALDYLTPANYLKGEDTIKQRLEIRTLWKKLGKTAVRDRPCFVRRPAQPDRSNQKSAIFVDTTHFWFQTFNKKPLEKFDRDF